MNEICYAASILSSCLLSIQLIEGSLLVAFIAFMPASIPLFNDYYPMLSPKQNRLDPSDFDREALDRLVATLARPGHVSLLDQEGKRTEIPEVFYRHLVRILTLVSAGRAVIMIPEDETFTTQAAANFIGISRKYLVNLLGKNEIAFHTVGTHRRIKFKDSIEHQKRRDASRRKGLDDLASKINNAGLYFPTEEKSSE